jgi:hypothetical protein
VIRIGARDTASSAGSMSGAPTWVSGVAVISVLLAARIGC